jgi:aryl-alcohol dehydrogenase-like predicted oxidoreductase
MLARFHGWTPVTAIQFHSLVERTVEGDLMPMARFYLGVTLLVAAPGGVLTGKYRARRRSPIAASA